MLKTNCVTCLPRYRGEAMVFHGTAKGRGIPELKNVLKLKHETKNWNAMNLIHRLSTTLVVAFGIPLLLGVSATPACAQDTPQPKASSDHEFDMLILDGVLQENGEEASLENAVDVLREKHPEANIVIAPEVPPILIENLKIRATDVRMQLEALRVASGDRFIWSREGAQLDPVTGLPIASAEDALYVLRAAPQASSQLRIEAFSLAGYLASLPKSDDPDDDRALARAKVEELRDVVDRTVEVYRAIDAKTYRRPGPPAANLDLQYHRGADLMILIGDAQSVEIASKIIGALPYTQRSIGGNPAAMDPFGASFPRPAVPGQMLYNTPAVRNSFSSGEPVPPPTPVPPPVRR